MKSIPGTTIESFVENEFGHCVIGRIGSAGINGSLIPTSAAMFGFGCMMIESSTGNVYHNTGTSAAPVWTAGNNSQSIQMAVNNLAPADIIATTAGSLSHANGLIMVPPAPTGFVNVWHRTIVSYTFGTAVYTGGGNTTVAIGGGGASLSGLIATTTLWQNGSSIIQEFVPLSTVAFPVTKETSINLKTASAITQPGTAAGTAKIYTWYSTVPIA